MILEGVIVLEWPAILKLFTPDKIMLLLLLLLNKPIYARQDHIITIISGVDHQLLTYECLLVSWAPIADYWVSVTPH